MPFILAFTVHPCVCHLGLAHSALKSVRLLGNGLKLLQEKFRLGIRKNVFQKEALEQAAQEAGGVPDGV